MSLELIPGSSGSGKSHNIYERIINSSMENTKERFFVMVPEQYTMQTQRDLVDMHPKHSILNIDVLSFNRLAVRIFDEVDYAHAPILEDMGKTLVIQKLIWDNKKELKEIGSTLKKPGGAVEAKSVISELMQYSLSPSDVAELAGKEGISPLLSRKLEAISIIYDDFKSYIEGKYLAAEEVSEVLAGVIHKSKLLKDSTVVFDGFTGFVPSQLMAIREIMKIAKKVIVVVTVDEKAGLNRKSSPANLFHMSHEMVNSLVKIASDECIPIESGNFIDSEKGRFAENEALGFLEQNLFRYNRNKYEKEQESIFITEVSSTEKEINYAASVINNLVRTKGYRYGDFAVICSDLNSYGRKMYRRFLSCQIPCFLDQKQSVVSNPAVMFVKGAVDIVTDGFTYDGVFSYLRSGLSGFTGEEIDLLENYVLGAGIQGAKKYESIWARKTKRFDEESLVYLNELRERFIAEIADVKAAFGEHMSTVRRKTEALYDLLVNCQVQKKLKDLEEGFAEENSKMLEKEYQQIYKNLVDFFDKLINVLGDEKIGKAAYKKLIESGFSQLMIGIIPTGLDEVIIGDLERSRVKNIKVAIFVGLNDGLVPKASDQKGFLSEDDRINIEKTGTKLAPSAKDDMFKQRFYLYLNLTAASEKIYLTYKAMGDDGKAAMPSYLIGAIKAMFPEITVKKISDSVFDVSVLETAPGRNEAFIKGLRDAKAGENENVFFELYKHLKDSENVDFYIDAAKIENPMPTLRKEVAEEIYSDRYSVSKLEQYAKCAFAYFCKYGLDLKERDVYEVQYNDIGDIIHKTLKAFFEEAAKCGGVRAISDSERIELTDKALDFAIGNTEKTAILETARDRGLKERIRMIVQSTTEAAKFQLSAGDFVTEGLEIPYKLGNLTGIIDRYDVCRAADETYVRVIDYKSSETKIDFSKMAEGLQIQLPVYLMAAKDIMKKETKGDPDKDAVGIKTAGIYYMHPNVPMQDSKTTDDYPKYEKFLDGLRLTGLSASEEEIMSHQAIEKSDTAHVVGVTITKKNEYKKNSPVISQGDFKLIERYTSKLVDDIEGRIKDGNIDIRPASSKAGKKDACKYCSFKGVCGFDMKIPGYEENVYKSLKRDTFCEEFSKRLTEGDKNGD